MKHQDKNTEESDKPRLKERPKASWEKFLQEIREARVDLGNPENAWYRGLWRSSYSLIPSLLRLPQEFRKEQWLFEKYTQAAAHLGLERESDWETLFDMQHYGIPTRLLDWTETLGVAIFFALGTSPSEAAVYVLDPAALNLHATGSPAIRHIGDSSFEYRSVYWDKRPFAPRIPIAMEPPFQNNRIFAQRGVFTIHGDDPRGLEEQYQDCIRKVILPLDAREDAFEFLEFASLNQLSIFPDIVGVAQHLTRRLTSTVM
jgi:hypothetical protein